MRKAISTLLLVIYTSLSIGVSISKHFCGGSLASTTFFSSEKKRCLCSLIKSSNEEKDCCKDETSVVKLEIDQNLAKISTFSFAKIVHLPVMPYFGVRFFPLKISLFNFKQSIKENPFPPKVPLYLAFRVFRI